MFDVVVGSMATIMGLGLLANTCWLWRSVNSDPNQDPYENGYHLFMALSGFLVAGPIILVAFGVFVLVGALH